MNREQACNYLRSSGFSEEQIKAIEGAFTCEDAISREAVINHICESRDCYKDECKGRLYKRCHSLEWVYELPSINPQKPKSECEHDHEILKAHSDGANEVLDIIKAEIESKYESISDTYHHYETGFTDALEWVLSVIDKYKAEGSEE